MTAFAASGNVVIQPLLSKKRVDILTQLAPVGMVTTSPHVLVVSSQLPASSVKELIDHAKANPGSLNFASAGVGGLAHLASELFMRQAGLPGFEYTTWYGLFGPAGVPPAVIDKLGAALGKLGADKAFEARLREQGVDLHISTPKVLAECTRKETAEWDKVIRDAGIHLN